MMKLEIVYLDPHELTPYENNTRKHTPEDIEQIKASIQADGFNDPLGIWGEKNLIVEGHGRQIAALEMGLDKVPCIRLDHMTETQRRDYAIRHNFTSDQSEFNFSKLGEEIAALECQGLDMGYLDALSAEIQAMTEPKNVEEGEPGNNIDKPVCVRIIFESAKEWRMHENEIRNLTDGLENVRLSVGGDDEDSESEF